MVNKEIKKGDEMKTYYKLGLEKINGVAEYHDLPSNTGHVMNTLASDTLAYLSGNLRQRGWKFSDLVGVKIYVDRFRTIDGKTRVLNFKITKSYYGLFKIGIDNFVNSYAYNPENDLRTLWGNHIHRDWIDTNIEEANIDIKEDIPVAERFWK